MQTPRQPLRGRTRPRRAAQLDRWLTTTRADLLSREEGPWKDAWVVDIGIGDDATTSWELSQATGAPVFAVDLVEQRVERARRAYPGLTVAMGDLDAAPPSGRARLVRALNVLRELPPERVSAAHERLGTHVVEGGLVLEGSTSRTGDVAVAHVLRRTSAGMRRESLVFASTFERGFAPRMFFHQLPRDLRRRVRGTTIDALILAWEEAAPRGASPQERFAAFETAEFTQVAPGIAQWTPPGGVPQGQ